MEILCALRIIVKLILFYLNWQLHTISKRISLLDMRFIPEICLIYDGIHIRWLNSSQVFLAVSVILKALLHHHVILMAYEIVS